MLPPMLPPQVSLTDIVRRTSVPFFLFAVTITGLLALSWFLLIPELTHVSIAGSVLSLGELKGYKRELLKKIVTLEDDRQVFLMPKNDQYQKLKLLKVERQKFQELRTAMEAIIPVLAPDRSDVVKIQTLSFDANSLVVNLSGEVHNVGPRSMTVLAHFVQQIEQIHGVTHVETPRYTRLETLEHDFYSPFTIQITLK